MARTGADLIVETLHAAGVKRIYGVAGDSLNGITDSLRRDKTIEWVHMRHEEAGAFAAGAEAHLTGELAVCAGSCGPGNLHLINGLFDCYRSRVPVLAIAAHIPSEEIGSHYFQATHPENLFAECSHYVELVSNIEHLPRILEKAIRIAVAERGVAVVVIPGDIALEAAPRRRRRRWVAPRPPVVRPSDGELDKLAALLNAGKRVAMMCGGGCGGAHAELIELARTLGAPMVHSLRGKEYLEYDNEFDVGMTGLIGFASGYAAMKECDTLLLMGTDFPYRQFYPEQRQGRAGRHPAREPRQPLPPRTRRCWATSRRRSTALLPKLKPKGDWAFLQRAREHYKKARADLDKLAEGGPGAARSIRSICRAW